MAFSFKRNESVVKAVRRLGRGRAEDALQCLEDCSQAEAIHCVRKEIKKARAVLRLVRANITKKACRRPTDLLREAANHLAATRDAYVTTKALEDLTGHFKGQLAPTTLRHIRIPLRKVLQEETRRFAKEKTVKTVARILRQAAREFDHVAVGGKGWKAICPGVKASYSKGRRDYHTALKDSSPENFHEWRKRAKELWYQVRLLRPVWPQQMEAIAEELKALGEYLGDDHDLFMLQRAVEEHCAGDGTRPELKILNGLIAQRQRELRAAALAIGARFYAEKPSAFCNRLGGYWKIWLDE